MKSTLFIPKKLKIGFQERTDTFTGKLAYVIYYDEKGKLRKEASWNSWCDSKIESIELDNTPMSGFVLNKGVQRYSDWGSGRSVIRVHDHRNFEFEISVDNLIGILMHSDVSKRDIVEQCVFAWAGTELVLLPCNSEAYQTSIAYTDKQSQKVSAKELVAGRVYQKKKSDETLTYIGYHEWFEFEYDHDYSNSSYGYGYHWGAERHSTSTCRQVSKGKKHVFYDGKTFVTPAVGTFSSAVSDEVSDGYAGIVDEFFKTTHSSLIEGPVQRPMSTEEQTVEYNAARFFKLGDDGVSYTTLNMSTGDNYGGRKTNKVTLETSVTNCYITDTTFSSKTTTKNRESITLPDTFTHDDYRSANGQLWYGAKIMSAKLAKELSDRGYGKLYYRLTNGNLSPVTN